MATNSDFVTSKEGELLLRVKRQMFFYYVKKGRIRKQESEKRGGTLYNRADILQLRNELQREEEPTAVNVDWMAISDLPAILALDIELYGEDEPLADISLYQAWWKKNPRTTIVAFEPSNRGRILAQCCLLPLTMETLDRVLSGNLNEAEISAAELESYQRKGKFNLLVESVIARPNHREALGPVLQGFANFWYEQWPERQIERIYGRAVSKEGEYLIRKLYFSPLYQYGEKAFVLDPKFNNPSRFIKSWKEKIANKQHRERLTPTLTPTEVDEDGQGKTKEGTREGKIMARTRS
ncbi:MAG: hypothetical protein H0X24_17140 [Ktedonobacterales bacterium]|nr:hypothetical protein [Ktedonobacterales bacterium]